MCSRRGSTTMPELKTAGIRHGEQFGERSWKPTRRAVTAGLLAAAAGAPFAALAQSGAPTDCHAHLPARAEACRRAPLCAGLRRDAGGLPAGPRRERHGARGARAAELPRHRQQLPARRAAAAPTRLRGIAVVGADRDEEDSPSSTARGRRHPPQPRRLADSALRRGALAGAPEARRRPRLAGRGASRGEGPRASWRRCSGRGHGRRRPFRPARCQARRRGSGLPLSPDSRARSRRTFVKVSAAYRNGSDGVGEATAPKAAPTACASARPRPPACGAATGRTRSSSRPGSRPTRSMRAFLDAMGAGRGRARGDPVLEEPGGAIPLRLTMPGCRR